MKKILVILLVLVVCCACERSWRAESCKQQAGLMNRNDLKIHCETWEGQSAVNDEYERYIRFVIEEREP